MSVLIIFNRQPYDGTDVTWHGLRFADKILVSRTESKSFPDE